ncbi:hypothetical protein HTZ97_12405 [Desulfuromonas acetoxidans]|uniref:DUF1858 domain-containing protein n=1 Tax=Desulfuromonas acetoxidans (strain DSM 684 / 11070) TaxID=281689 RepID=Q1JWW1_DESA6|nr:hypothetical protein [Desulfuromonas acetoxidans]EAT14683.1 hypothetical protein Dace_0647 [Desulfuromonas acetoxidans DSM 684]MBF0646052.1 hypothetical protein [Desulfuromonas acetoxidans]NVD25128.1 hypothetical protein [Desulfuromonas acetoxidans]NVE17250.1 hypothetical protein [Desulfuromonas acetoxidans]
MTITSETLVEEILDLDSRVVRYFILNKVKPFTCGGAYPQTLSELLARYGVEDVEAFIAGLNTFIADEIESS